MKIVITGAAGFVGSHIVEHFLKNTDWDIYVLDKLTYASSGLDRIRDIESFNERRIKFFAADLQQPISDGVKQEIGMPDYIINLASESHVDNSIKNPVEFIENNTKLMLHMLEWARELHEAKPAGASTGDNYLKKFIQFSTDEVYGTAPDGINYE